MIFNRRELTIKNNKALKEKSLSRTPSKKDKEALNHLKLWLLKKNTVIV